MIPSNKVCNSNSTRAKHNNFEKQDGPHAILTSNTSKLILSVLNLSAIHNLKFSRRRNIL